MPCLADGLQQCAVFRKAVSIAPLLLTSLEHRLKVVEHEQASLLSQQLEQRCDSRRVTLRRRHAIASIVTLGRAAKQVARGTALTVSAYRD